MDVCKHYPGRFESTFVAGMNRSSATTGTLESTFPVNEVLERIDGAGEDVDKPLGTCRYTLIAYSPILSALYGASTGLGASSKLAGLIIVQTDELDTGEILRFADFDDIKDAYTMSDLYGSNGSDVYNNAMIWASRIEGQTVGPQANLAGVAKYGFFNIGSMFDDGVATNFTLNNLKTSIFHEESLKETQGKFSLQNAIVNHDIGMKMGLSFSNVSDDNAFASEYVAFVILEAPYQSISDGNLMQFSIDAVVRSNYVANPRVTNAFARGLVSTVD
jgi:hypothetical protein